MRFRASSLSLLDIILQLIDPNGVVHMIDSAGAGGQETFTTGSATPGVWRAVLSLSTDVKQPDLDGLQTRTAIDTYQIDLACTPYCP